MKEFKIYSRLCLLIMIVFVFTIASCKKDKDEDAKPEPQQVVTNEPGKIPGLGETAGTHTGSAFSLPDGVTFDGEIKGKGFYEIIIGGEKKSKKELLNEMSIDKPNLLKSTNSVALKGGGIFVVLNINLKNNKAEPKEVVFPAGLIAKSKSGNYQNGVLLKKTSIIVPANETITVYLCMFCGNSSLDASDFEETYEFTVVSNSSLIIDLCNRLKTKKINVDEYNLELEDDFLAYWSNITVVQDALWSITDYYDGLTEDIIASLNALPESGS